MAAVSQQVLLSMLGSVLKYVCVLGPRGPCMAGYMSTLLGLAEPKPIN